MPSKRKVSSRHDGGRLRDRAVNPATKKRYSAALDGFFVWICAQRLAFDPRRRNDTDMLCELYVDHLYDNRFPRGMGSDFLSAMQDAHPHLRRHLPCSWRALGVWMGEQPPQRVPPLPRLCLVGLVVLAFLRGDWPMACCLLLQFHCYLRPAELFSLRACDVSFHRRGQARGVVALRHTKTTGRKRAMECVTIEDPIVCLFLRLLVSDFPPSPATSQLRLWPFPSAAYGVALREMLASLSLSEFGFTPYSLRRGGAAFDFRRSNSFDRAQHRGRWASVKCAKIYLTDALAAQVAFAIPDRACVRLRAYELLFRELCSQLGVVGVDGGLLG